ncbi:MAG: fatty acid desaturase [Pseudomonadota bacterium]
MDKKQAAARQSDVYLELRRSLLPPERVRELSQLRPWRVAVDAAFCWALIVAAWVMVALEPTWWSVLVAIPIVGTRYYALWVIGHDGLHRRLFPKARHSDLFGDLFVFAPIGAITRLNNRNHLDHHHHLATALDPDRHKHGSFNKTTLLELVGFLSGVSSLLRSVRNVFTQKPKGGSEQAETRRYTLRDLSILIAWQVALIGGLSWAIGFWAWPVLWLFPVYVFTFLGDNARAFVEHSHPESDAHADRHRLVTVTSNPLERVFFAPMHMNLHTAHHLWPSIPYYNLPIAERELRRFPAAREIDMRDSYVGYIWRYMRNLRIQDDGSESKSVSST